MRDFNHAYLGELQPISTNFNRGLLRDFNHALLRSFELGPAKIGTGGEWRWSGEGGRHLLRWLVKVWADNCSAWACFSSAWTALTSTQPGMSNGVFGAACAPTALSSSQSDVAVAKGSGNEERRKPASFSF